MGLSLSVIPHPFKLKAVVSLLPSRNWARPRGRDANRCIVRCESETGPNESPKAASHSLGNTIRMK